MKNIFKGKHEFSEPNEQAETLPERTLNKKVNYIHQVLKIVKKKHCFRMWGIFLYIDKRESDDPHDLKKTCFLMGDYKYPIKKILKIKLSKKIELFLYKLDIPYKDILNAGIHNDLYISAINNNGIGYKKHFKYIAFMPTKPSILWHGPIKKFPKKNISTYFRQGSKNFVYITAKEINITDKFGQRVVIALAFILSRILFFIKTIVLFEKHSSEYQASASVMFEKLIDKGYKRVYFILDKKYEDKYEIKPKYKKHIVWKYSFKHYLVFFMSKLYLSSESIFHGTELRTINRFIHFHALLTKAKIPYIFLQHGVMYMVRLDAEYRWGFQFGRQFKEKSRVVVSSELEAQHFIKYANFPRENLYITGLAQWDRVEYDSLSKKADKIMILPTWRHWELAEARINPEQTGYYKLMERIVRNVPKKYRGNILLIPHPLVIEYFKSTELGKYIPKDTNNWISYMDKVKILITDYSSISYFAFYRGSNVIFDWSDLDECMEMGYKGALMLNEENTIGDIVYNEDSNLADLVEQNMTEDRREKYVGNYSKIVEFKDGHNADRIVMKLKEDGFLKR
jgi:hypothetical protein